MSVPKTNQYKKQKAGTRNAGERKQASANHSIFGMIIGAALTVGGAYIADAMAGREAKPIVNWSVVAENIDTVTALARAGWKRIAG
jgi:hypothetical protein